MHKESKNQVGPLFKIDGGHVTRYLTYTRSRSLKMYSYQDIALQTSWKSGGYVMKINNVNVTFRIVLKRV